MMDDRFSGENRVFRAYVTYGGLLLIKMLTTAFMAGFQRIRTGAFVNPEDLVLSKSGEIKSDEKVERWRRAHLNDLENIPAFLIAGFFYVCSQPDIGLALWLFRIATLARFVHTIVYAVYPIRQPARGISYHVCWWITVFMIIASMVEYFEI